MYGYVTMDQIFRIHTFYTAFRRRILGEYAFVGERHNFWELVIVTEGEIGITAGEEVQRLRQGEAYLHEPMEFHRLWKIDSRSVEIIVITFGADNAPYSGRLLTVPDPKEACEIIDQFCESFKRDGINVVGMGENPVRSQILLKRLELLLLEARPQEQPASLGVQSATARNYIRMIRLLENHVDKNLSVSDVARMCNMSTVNAKQTFSRYAGMGIREYFNRLKIKAATSMLQNGNSVQETAELLGFSSQQYFCTVFRRITGMTPSACKREAQEKA